MTTATKDEHKQKGKAYIKALNKNDGLRRRVIALCWAHAETRKQFSQGEDEWTPQDQLVCNLLSELEITIDELTHPTCWSHNKSSKTFLPVTIDGFLIF